MNKRTLNLKSLKQIEIIKRFVWHREFYFVLSPDFQSMNLIELHLNIHELSTWVLWSIDYCQLVSLVFPIIVSVVWYTIYLFIRHHHSKPMITVTSYKMDENWISKISQLHQNIVAFKTQNCKFLSFLLALNIFST